MYIICFLPESLTFIKKPHTHCTYRKSVMITNMKLSALSSTPRTQQPLLVLRLCSGYSEKLLITLMAGKINIIHCKYSNTRTASRSHSPCWETFS